MTDADRQRVLAAIAANEDPARGGGVGCDNEVVVKATGLSSVVVAAVLEQLWRENRIEGVLTMAGVRPYLVGMLRVLPDRPRTWGSDGMYVAQPS